MRAPHIHHDNIWWTYDKCMIKGQKKSKQEQSRGKINYMKGYEKKLGLKRMLGNKEDF